MPECEHNDEAQQWADDLLRCQDCGRVVDEETSERLYRPAEVAEIVQIFTRWIFNPDAPVLVELGSRYPDIAAALRGKERGK